MAFLKKSDILVALPAFNEEANIASVIKSVQGLGYPVLVVDDGSKDKTASIADSLGVRVIVNQVNQGKGASLKRAIDFFLEGHYRIFVVMDADGQHDPNELHSLIEPIERGNYGMVIGTRMENPEGMPWIRRATNWFMSWLLSLIAHQKIADTQCGYRAIRREVLEKVCVNVSRYEIESELILEASKHGYRIGSVPIRSVYAGQKSEIRPMKDTYRFLRFLTHYHLKTHHLDRSKKNS